MWRRGAVIWGLAGVRRLDPCHPACAVALGPGGSPVGPTRAQPHLPQGKRQGDSQGSTQLFVRPPSLSDVGQQCHEARALDGGAGGSLKRRTTAAALAGKHLVLVGAQLLEQADVLVIDVGGSRTSFRSAEPAAILAVASELLPRHRPEFLSG